MPLKGHLRLSVCRNSCRVQPWSQRLAIRVQQRGFADDRPIADRPFENPPDEENRPKGPNMDPLPHVSEEKAAVSKSMGEEGPAIEQGRPVSEVVKDDPKAQENLPKVMKDQIKKDEQAAASTSASNSGSQKRSFSTYARAQSQFRAPYSRNNSSFSHSPGHRGFSTFPNRKQNLEEYSAQNDSPAMLNQPQQLGASRSVAELDGSLAVSMSAEGLKFGIPQKLAKEGHLRKRYEPIVTQVTKLMMKDGKLSQAQRHMEAALKHLRTSPAPRQASGVALVPGAPPHEALPINPTIYMQVAIDSIAPVLKMRMYKKMAGGGMSLAVPSPLGLRQRRRTATMWILEQVLKRKGSTSPFGKRFGEELVAIVEGRSSLWERRNALHTLGMRSRANLTTARNKMRK